MFCTKCGTELTNISNFCYNCGEKVNSAYKNSTAYTAFCIYKYKSSTTYGDIILTDNGLLFQENEAKAAKEIATYTYFYGVIGYIISANKINKYSAKLTEITNLSRSEKTGYGFKIKTENEKTYHYFEILDKNNDWYELLYERIKDNELFKTNNPDFKFTQKEIVKKINNCKLKFKNTIISERKCVLTDKRIVFLGELSDKKIAESEPVYFEKEDFWEEIFLSNIKEIKIDGDSYYSPIILLLKDNSVVKIEVTKQIEWKEEIDKAIIKLKENR